MAETVGEEPRVKFEAVREGPLPAGLEAEAAALAEALAAMEAAGCCPVLDDGLAAGNGALRLSDGSLLLSPSGRRSGGWDPGAAIQLLDFDAASWRARYRSRDLDRRPTSDAPLHWAALVEAPLRFGWARAPGASLHGHILETARAAELLGVPLSAEATRFSTPPDRAALLALLERAPFPAHRTVIRRDHGFFTLGRDLAEARATVRDLAERARAHGLL